MQQQLQYSQLAQSGQQAQYGQQAKFPQGSAAGTLEQLAALSPPQRVAFYEQTLVQRKTIHILSDGTFSKLEDQLMSAWQLTVPTHESDTIAAEAAQIFYSRNEFAVAIGTVPNFVAWQIGSYFRPSDLVTRIAVLYGPPDEPGGGNAELLPLLSIPRLRSARLVFQDHTAKGKRGATAYLRPSACVIMELKEQRALTLTLQLKPCKNWQLELNCNPPEDDEDTEPRRGITNYLSPLTAAEEQLVDSSRRIWGQYRGPCSFIASALMESGWSTEASYGILDLYERESIPRWVEEQRLEILATQDVEMF